MTEEATRNKTWANMITAKVSEDKIKLIHLLSWRPWINMSQVRNGDGTMTYRGAWGVEVGYLGGSNCGECGIGKIVFPYATVNWTMQGDIPSNADAMVNAAVNLAAAEIDPAWANKINDYLVDDKDERERLRTNYILSLVEYYKNGSGGGSGQVTRGTRVRVARGRKVPKGTEGVIIWLGTSTFMGKTVGRCGVKDDAGNVHWTATSNVDTIGGKLNDEQAINEAKRAYVCSGGDWILGPIRN